MAHCFKALCEEDFCENGGECLYPDTNCTCTEQWTGPQCQIGKHTVYYIMKHVWRIVLKHCVKKGSVRMEESVCTQTSTAHAHMDGRETGVK